jgi:hypothetical protein
MFEPSCLHSSLFPKRAFFRACLLSAVFAASCSEEGGMDSLLNAAAGNDQNVQVGDEVTLDGGGSSDSQGNPFEFSWRFISKPGSSSSQLDNSTSEEATFVPDAPGKYRIELAISNASQSLDTVSIFAFKVITVAGSYENVIPGSNVGVRTFKSALDALFATCEFSEIGGIEAKKIARYSEGSWHAMGCGLEEGSIYGMAEYEGELYVTGDFEEIGCIPANNIAKWDGSAWHALGNGLTGGENPFGYALAVFDGELYAGGQFTMAGNVNAVNIAKWDGNEWSAVGSIEDGSVRVLQVYKQKLYAGGYFTEVNGADIRYITAYDGNDWSALGATGHLELKSVGAVRKMAVLNDVLYIAGNFSVSNEEISELSTWDGTQFSDFGRPFTLHPGNSIRDLKVIAGVLYIGGEFSSPVAATPAKNILQWDGASWGVLDEGIAGTVLSIETFNGSIYIGGDFETAGGSPAENISIWSED